MNNNNRRYRENPPEKSYRFEGYGERNSSPRNAPGRNQQPNQFNQSNQYNPRRREDNQGNAGKYNRPDERNLNFRSGYNQRSDERPRTNTGYNKSRPSRFDNRTEDSSSENFRRPPRRDNNSPNFRDDSRRRRPVSGEQRKNFQSKPIKKEFKKLPPKPKIVSDLQITDGKHVGKHLATTTSPKYRATPRKLREIMFKILSRRIRARRFLDLYSGNGIIGFEAISRGALLSTFVERSARMRAIIRKNMETLEIREGHAEIFDLEVLPFMKDMCKRRRNWDIIFLSPPFDTNYDEILNYFKKGTCVRVKGIMVIEHHTDMFFPEKLGLLSRTRVITEGDTSLSFFERK